MAMIAPRMETMFNVVPGQPEGGDDAKQRQQRPHPDGQRFQKRPEFQHQHGVDEHQGRDQDERKVPKRLLLLLVQAAEFDRDFGRQRDSSRQVCL